MLFSSQLYTRLLVALMMSSISDRDIADTLTGTVNSRRLETGSVENEGGSASISQHERIVNVGDMDGMGIVTNGLLREPSSVHAPATDGLNTSVIMSSSANNEPSAIVSTRNMVNRLSIESAENNPNERGGLNEHSIVRTFADNTTNDDPLSRRPADYTLAERASRAPAHDVPNEHQATGAVATNGGMARTMPFALPEIPNLIETGLDAQIVALYDRRGMMYNRLMKQIQIAEQLMESSNIDMMNAEVANVDRKLFEFMEVNERCQGLSRGQDSMEAAKVADEVDSKVFELKQAICKWMKVQEDDNRSRISKSSNGSKRSRSSGASSHFSKRSSSSKGSHSSNKSVENKARLAGLKMEAELLERSMEKKIEKEIVKLREERTSDLSTQLEELKKQIAISEAKQLVYEDDDTRNDEPIDRYKDVTVRRKVSNMPKVDIDCASMTDRAAPEVVSMPRVGIDSANNRDRVIRAVGCDNSTSTLQASTATDMPNMNVNSVTNCHPCCNEDISNGSKSSKIDVAQAMMQMININSAPVSDIDVFGGNPLDYDYFRATFADVVESKIKDQRGKLTRLIKYTTGEAKDLIKEFIHEDAETCFDMAINALNKEYGDSQRLTAAYLKELRQWPVIKSYDAKGYRTMHRFLLKCKIVKKRGKLSTLDSAETIRLILSKFSNQTQEVWNKLANRMRQNKDRDADFDDLVVFIENQTSLINNPYYSRDAFNENKDRRIATVSTFSTKCDNETHPEDLLQCPYCEENHQLENCATIEEKNIDERLDIIRRKKLCFGCFKPMNKSHYARICRSKLICSLCNERHPTLLHEYHRKSMSVSTVKQTNDCNIISLSVVPVIVYHESQPDLKLKVYAMLDACSQGTFIDESILTNLPSVVGRNTVITVKTMNGEESVKSTAINGLIVTCTNEFADCYPSTEVRLPTVYTQEDLPFGAAETPTPGKIMRWKHLANVARRIPEYDESIPFGLLIGGNCVKALEPCDVVPSRDEGPYAVRTRLGWCVVGPIKSDEALALKCNFVASRIATKDISTDSTQHRHQVSYNDIKEDSIHQFLEQMYQVDFIEEHSERKSMSKNDRKFIEIMEESVTKQNGHYVLPLPFKEETIHLANNRIQAEKRCQSIKRKMLNDTKYFSDYTNFMNSIIEKEYAKEADAVEPVGRTWYVPHHGVYHPTKNKIRVVFDAAASFNGSCLNEQLIAGPDLTSSLVGVLIRFREELIPFTADIESMFYQVRVPEHQQSFLRFLWWPNGDLSKELKAYQMCVHIFGASSSPGCANFALRRTAVDHGSDVSPEATDVLNDNFYVDDLIKSTETESQASKLACEVALLCSKGGFNLTKFTAINPKVLENLPEEKKSDKSTKVAIETNDQIERALGVIWCLENDCLSFRIILKDVPLTRRGVLSTISSIFDPLGLASPFLLKGKKILQSITGEHRDWDEPLTEAQRKAWEQWRNVIPGLEQLSIRRCYKECQSAIIDKSIHCFSDASDIGYGNAVYIRHVYSDGNIDVSLMLGKSRVAPLKKTTTPRLELVAATTSVKVSALLQDELRDDIPARFWTDSKIVLGYINNCDKRFRIFVANRLQVIHNYSSVQQWEYVDTKENPADHASRGISVEEKEKVDMWLYGPAQLRKPKECCDVKSTFEISDDDPEVQTEAKIFASRVQEKPHDILSLIESKFSRWMMMKHVMAWILRFIKGCQRLEYCKDVSLSVCEMETAEKLIIKLVQAKMYPTLVTACTNGSGSKKGDKQNIWKLNPYLDEDGILRVEGRLRKAPLEINKNPIILPKQSVVSQRIVEYHHAVVAHSGRTTTISEIRSSGYWIVGVNVLARKVIFYCIKCRKLRGELGEQKMSDLPKERFAMDGPFSYCGLDMFGPFYTKLGRNLYKRYVALFTCLSSKAIHLEATFEMSTDSFINALRRFLTRRGPIRSIQSDNGTNFLGADNEFAKIVHGLDQSKVKGFLSSNNCDWILWKRNPPHSSHRGGIWERAIRSARAIIDSLMMENNQHFDDEVFRTFLCEVESIMNSRPITSEASNDPTIEALTPNHLLTMKSKLVMPPPGEFQRSDLYCRKRWRVVQHLANQFWLRWKKEYVLLLQQRQKWNNPKRNFAIDDVVLLKDEECKRNQWPLARITSVYTDDDGLVRSVELRTERCKTTLKRPIQKLVLLVEAQSGFAGGM